MSNRTPYDTGKRSEPKVWSMRHIDSDDDYGKVDFDDDAGGTIATLYIEMSDDRSYYTLKGYTNEPLKVEIDDQSDGEEEIEGVERVHWFPMDLIERRIEVDGKMKSEYGQIVQIEQVPGKVSLWVARPGTNKPEMWPAGQCRLLRRG